MSQNQIMALQNKWAHQENEICHLKERLNKYNKAMTEKDALQKQFIGLQRWVEETEIYHKQSNAKQLNIINCQFKKLEKSELVTTSLRADNKRLNSVNECHVNQLKTLTQNEQRLLSEIEKLETLKKNLETELCNVKNELREKNCTVENLTNQLKVKQKELQCVRNKLKKCQTAVDQLEDRRKNLETTVASAKAKLEECQATGCRLRRRSRDLDVGLEGARAKLEDAKSLAAATEARLKAEVGGLAAELECRARKLRDAEAECDEWKRRVAEEQCRANKLGALVVELRAAGERERCEAEAREQRLKRDVRERDEEARRRDEQLAAARQKNDDAAAGAAALKKRVRATVGQLEDVRRSAEARERAQDEARERLEHEKAALSGEVRRKTAEVAELGRQVCRLRDGVRRCRVRAVTCSPQARRLDDHRDAGRSDCSAVTADDSFISKLKRLYRDLELSNKNKSRRY